jgi:hypothetical protein
MRRFSYAAAHAIDNKSSVNVRAAAPGCCRVVVETNGMNATLTPVLNRMAS